jgi:hypothetical protein
MNDNFTWPETFAYVQVAPCKQCYLSLPCTLIVQALSDLLQHSKKLKECYLLGHTCLQLYVTGRDCCSSFMCCKVAHWISQELYIYANVVHGHPPKFLLLILTHIDLLLLSMYKELFGRYTIWVT